MEQLKKSCAMQTDMLGTPGLLFPFFESHAPMETSGLSVRPVAGGIGPVNSPLHGAAVSAKLNRDRFRQIPDGAVDVRREAMAIC